MEEFQPSKWVESKPTAPHAPTPIKVGPPKRVRAKGGTAAPKPRPKKPKTKLVSDTSGGVTEGSARVRMFKCLALTDHLEGFTLTEIKVKCAIPKTSGHLDSVVKEEVERGRLRCKISHRGRSAAPHKVYSLTPIGRRDLARGHIDHTKLAGRRIGKSWAETGRA